MPMSKMLNKKKSSGIKHSETLETMKGPNL